MIRAALALHEATGEQGYLDQALTWQRALDRHYANAETGALLPHRRRCRGPRHAPGVNGRRSNAEPQRGRGAKSGPAGAARRRRRVAREGRPADRGDCAAGGRESLHAHGAAQRPRSAAARRRDRRDRAGRRAPTHSLAAARGLPPLDRIVLHARSADACRRASGAGEDRALRREPQAFVCVGETCSLPVTEPAELTRRSPHCGIVDVRSTPDLCLRIGGARSSARQTSMRCGIMSRLAHDRDRRAADEWCGYRHANRIDAAIQRMRKCLGKGGTCFSIRTCGNANAPRRLAPSSHAARGSHG